MERERNIGRDIVRETSGADRGRQRQTQPESIQRQLERERSM